MADWLVYWKDVAGAEEVTPDWHSSSERLFERAHPGDVIWVVVSGGAGSETEWRLLESFTVRMKGTIADTAKGYKYRFVGDEQSHEVFDPWVRDDLTPVLKSLVFSTNWPIRFSGRQIGMALQGPRELAEEDACELGRYRETLPRVHRTAAGTG